MPLAGFHNHISALASVATRRPAPRNKFFPAEGHAAVAAIPRLHPNSGFIDEHGCIKSNMLALNQFCHPEAQRGILVSACATSAACADDSQKQKPRLEGEADAASSALPCGR